MVTAATKAKADSKPGGTEAKPPAAEKKETVQQLKNRLRNEAEREVLNAHKDEVHRLTKEKYDAHGLEYVRRLTDEEKAEKEIAERLAKFPNLRKQFEAAKVEEDDHVANDFDPQFGAPENDDV